MFEKPVNCNCGPGGFQAWGEKWVVLTRRPSPSSSQLKCLRCGWKWWSTAKYVHRLVDHVEKSYSGMTDQDILDRIIEGSLTVLVNEGRVFSITVNGLVELKQIERESNGSTYRFVEITRNKKKKKIAVHRLVWMFSHRSLVPEGYDVDHIEDKRNTIDNLRLLESSKNRSRGKPVKLQAECLPFDEVPF